MKDQDKQAFALIMGGLGAAYRVNVERETMGVYFRYLASFPIEAVRYAVDQAITRDDRFPAVARLRDFANAYRPSIAHLIPRIDNLIPEFSEADAVVVPSSDKEAAAFFDQILRSVA